MPINRGHQNRIFQEELSEKTVSLWPSEAELEWYFCFGHNQELA